MKQKQPFYLLSVFLALVAMPMVMGVLMAFHPEGAWVTDRVDNPLAQMSWVSVLLIVFSGLGFAFWAKEFSLARDMRVPRLSCLAGWLWSGGVHLVTALAVKYGALTALIYDQPVGALVMLLVVSWVPVLCLYQKSGALQQNIA
jgi:hypothetical protein